MTPIESFSGCLGLETREKNAAMTRQQRRARFVKPLMAHFSLPICAGDGGEAVLSLDENVFMVSLHSEWWC